MVLAIHVAISYSGIRDEQSSHDHAWPGPWSIFIALDEILYDITNKNDLIAILLIDSN